MSEDENRREALKRELFEFMKYEPTHEQLISARASGLDAWVYFVINSEEKKTDRYHSKVEGIVGKWLETHGIPSHDRPRGNWNMEGGLGRIVVNGHHYSHCKFYMFDETSNLGERYGRGVLIREHCDYASDVLKVQEIANDFELFLNQERVSHERKNRERGHDISLRG